MLGSSTVGRANHRRPFRKLGGNKWDNVNRKFHVEVVVSGPGKSLRVTEMVCDDSASDSSCPQTGQPVMLFCKRADDRQYQHCGSNEGSMAGLAC